MPDSKEEPSFREKPRNRKSIIRDEVEKRLNRPKTEGILQKKPPKGKKYQVWCNPAEVKEVEMVQGYHGYATPSETFKQAIRRDLINVAIKAEQIAEIRAKMERYKIRVGELQ